MVSREWPPAARDDLWAIVDYIAEGSPVAAFALLDDIETKVARLAQTPTLYKTDRVKGTRELVLRSNCIVVYAVEAEVVSILRILHAARQWPTS